MAFLFTSCYHSCPLAKFLIPRRTPRTQILDVELGECGAEDEDDIILEMQEIASLRQEGPEMFDRADDDANADEQPFDATLDHLRLVAQYSDQKQLLIVTVVEAGGEQDVKDCKEAQVRVTLLCDKVVRKHTEFATGPVFKFNKTFAFQMERDKLPDAVVRMRLYRKRMPKRHQLVGECYLKCKKVDVQAVHLLKLRAPIMCTKKPAQLISVIQDGDIVAQQLVHEVSSTFFPSPIKQLQIPAKPDPALLRKITAAHGSEVLISLAYSEEHETLRIGIEKTSAFEKLKDEEGKTIDCYFQIIVRSDNTDLCKNRTKTFNSSSECEVDEVVVVPATLKELHDITVIIGLFCVSPGFLKRRALLGWIRMGADEMESADAAEHWMEMVQDIGRSVERWHNLRRPKNLTL